MVVVVDGWIVYEWTDIDNKWERGDLLGGDRDLEEYPD